MYSSSVGHVRLSLQSNSIPCPLCRHSSSSIKLSGQQRNQVRVNFKKEDRVTETSRCNKRRREKHTGEDGEHFGVGDLGEFCQCEKVDVVSTIDRRRYSKDLVRH